MQKERVIISRKCAPRCVPRIAYLWPFAADLILHTVLSMDGVHISALVYLDAFHTSLRVIYTAR